MRPTVAEPRGPRGARPRRSAMTDATVLPDDGDTDTTAPCVLVVLANGSGSGRVWIVDRPLVIGREGDVQLEDPTVSRKHLRIAPRPGGALVTDLGSSAGTAVEQRRIQAPTLVRPGQAVRVGSTELLLARPVSVPRTTATWTVTVTAGDRVTEAPLPSPSVVGRDPGCDLIVDDARVSARHLRLSPATDHVQVEELGSSNGTRLDGRSVTSRAIARDGDLLELGSSSATVRLRRAAPVDPSVEVHVRAAASDRGEVLVIEAGGGSLVGDVARSVAAELGIVASVPTLCRRRDGLLLLPDDHWSGTGVRRGDELVLVELSSESVRRLRRASTQLTPTAAATVPSLPRTTLPPEPRLVRLPTPPESPGWRGRGIGWQVLGGIAAVSVGLVIAVIRPEYAVFGIVAATAGALALGAGILADQARRKGRAAQFRRELRDLDKDLAATRQDQATAYWELSPDADELERRVRLLEPALWSRRAGHPDALALRLGTGAVPTRVDLGTQFRTGSPLEAELTDLLDAHRLVSDVPVCVPASDVPSIGLVGDADVVEALAGRMIVEAGCLHPPTDLRVWVLDPHGTWDWARWLPHAVAGSRTTVADGAESARQLATDLLAILRREPDGADLVHLVVVPASERPAGTEEILARIGGRGLAVLTARSSRELPSGLASLLRVDERRTGELTGMPSRAVTGKVQVERLAPEHAERIAMALAPLTPGDRRAPSTGDGGLCELNGIDPTQLDLGAVWRRPRDTRVSATLAVDDDGVPVQMAMREHGPHGVIAGITGSGKSELLLSFLAALAVTHSPEDLNLFLIDYKGGATFAPLERLPHIAGLVTDLETDGDLVGRAFTALDAEIKRRKQLLADAAVPNIIDYQARSGVDALPDLLVVIDEFAELVRQREDVRGRLDTVATQGRSLGIHLLLACQSPTGAVSHAVRTNTNLWVCLRVGRDEESREMLGSVEAARLDDQARGRGFIRRGAAGDLLGFQAVRVTAPVSGSVAQVSVHRPGSPPRALPGTASGDAVAADGVADPVPATELDLIVDASLDACRSGGLRAARSLWLDPLPDDLTADDMTAGAPTAEDGELHVPVDRLVAHVGLLDRPDLQRQEPYLIDLTKVGNALACGQLGFGKSTTLRRIALDLARRHGPGDLHLYGLDAGSGSLAEVDELPQCAGVVGVEDSDRMVRLLRRLGRTMTERRELLAAAGGASFVEWRRGRDDAPWVVLLLDDLATFRDNSELTGPDQPMDVLNALLQGGPSVGIHVVIGAAQPADLRIAQLNLVPERLLFRQAEAADYQVISVRVTMSDQPKGPPGRAMVAGGHQLQVIRNDLADLRRVLDRWQDCGQALPVPVRRLTDEVTLSSLRRPDGTDVVLGMGGPELEPVRIDLRSHGAVLSVVGPHGSGRSTALLALFEAVVAVEPGVRCWSLAPRPGPLGMVAGHPQTAGVAMEGEAAAELLDRLLDQDTLKDDLVLIDDVAALAPALGDSLERLVRAAPNSGLRCVLSLRTGELTSTFEPWARYIAGLRHQLLLQPTREEAYSAGVVLPGSVTRWPPGRGLLVRGSSGELVQVGLPDLLRAT
jgi:S-DNA-T family DNA segregation ATPase FtsK/SpoIIIE